MSYLNVFIIYWILTDRQYTTNERIYVLITYIMADKPRLKNLRTNSSFTYVKKM